ncbi:MAG: ABC transporter substrate-binding protein [Geminicoccaceae bacterium]
MRYICRTILVTIVVSLIAVAPSRAAAPVKVGALLGVTGLLADFVPPMLDSMRLAIRQINEQGGVLDGRTLELVIADSMATSGGAVAAANRLVEEEKVVAVLGALSSAATMASATAVTIPNRVVMISPTATAPELTSLVDDDYVFRVLPGIDSQGKTLARIVYSQDIASVAVTYVNNDYGVGIADGFRQGFEALGGEITGILAHEERRDSYRAPLAALGGKGSDSLVVIARAGSSGIAIIRSALENGTFKRFIGTDGLLDDRLPDQIDPADIGASFVAAPVRAAGGKSAALFDQAYEKTYGSTEDKFFIEHAYDAAFLIGLAIERAGSGDRTAIRDALREVANPPGSKVLPGEWEKAKKLIAAGEDIDYEGAGGPVDFDEAGNVPGLTGRFVIESGAFVETGVFR